ncbi:MAG: hypothetical protein ACREEE_08605, partial [Dongiaceae bacterium]
MNPSNGPHVQRDASVPHPAEPPERSDPPHPPARKRCGEASIQRRRRREDPSTKPLTTRRRKGNPARPVLLGCSATKYPIIPLIRRVDFPRNSYRDIQLSGDFLDKRPEMRKNGPNDDRDS